MTPLISIVVPVFNVERYLSACLGSLQKQTLSDIEVICVNDASPDGSGSLLEAAAKQDARVRVLSHASNRGLSAARNTGLRAASSPWVLFVDSDDLAASFLCERALAAATRLQSDAVFFNYAVFRDGHETPPEPAPGAAAVAERAALLRRPAFAWTKLVRTKLMRGNGIEFPEGLCFEDTPVHWRLVLESKLPIFLDEPLVYYRQREGSITSRSDWSFADNIRIHDLLGNYLRATSRWNDWKEIFLAQQLSSLAYTYAYYAARNPALTQRVNQELRARMTAEHWEFLLHGECLSQSQRDYLIACGRPAGVRTSPALLLPILRHRITHPLRCLWHRVSPGFSG
jgi:glycosyltransferase involved in cell wall biosynthesis